MPLAKNMVRSGCSGRVHGKRELREAFKSRKAHYALGRNEPKRPAGNMERR